MSLVCNPLNQIFISSASYWEIAINTGLGKYPIQVPFEEFITRGIEDNKFSILPIAIAHAAALVQLPYHHRDPFDRMLVAQSLAEQIPLISCDARLDAYGIVRQ